MNPTRTLVFLIGFLGLLFASTVAQAETAIGGAIIPVPTMLHVQQSISEKGSIGVGYGTGSSGSAWDVNYKHSFGKQNDSTFLRIGGMGFNISGSGIFSGSGSAAYATIGQDWMLGESFFVGIEMGVAVNPNTGGATVYPNFRYMYRF